MKLYFDYGGLSFRVEADVTDGVVEGVRSVEIVCSTGEYAKMEVDYEEFFKVFADPLNDAVEDSIRDEYLAHCDMLYDQAKEEGSL